MLQVPQAPQISYGDLSQILMAGIAIAVALFAVALAVVGSVLGFLGYQSIRKVAIEAAEKAVAEKLKEYFEAPELPEKIKNAIQTRIAEEADLVVANLMPYLAFGPGAPEGGTGSERRIADDYPDKRRDSGKDRPTTGEGTS